MTGEVYDPGTRRAPLHPIVPGTGSYGGEPHAGSGGAGFQYDEATLRELMHEWNDLANEFAEDQNQAALLQQAKGPGTEYASGGNAEHVRASGDALHATLVAREEYCRSMAKKFETALGKYSTTEDTHTTTVNQAGGSL
ncbi:hypothetical protein M8542_21245 [Amycolatopsis sp. OK19-0408]|uniref:Uncharacterized protein n=1 Tax=Amycolatopsis iheyensis TaxID=2945988 RepID=A0A9X2NE87_9PSEU|nr:hypothetical protein [Amycolatopsis iheyensis]MCR6485357.1 hypothetical protein [Amycolatopsis iheyensis]